MEKKKAGKLRLPLFSYVSYLLVASFLLTGVTFSGYITTIRGGDDSRVAHFGISESGVSEAMIEATIVPGETVTKDLTIQNKSEVAIDYTVEITNVTKNLPISFSVNDVETVDGKFSDVLQPNEPTKLYVLQIVWDENDSSPYYSGMIDQLKVSVRAEQRD